MKVLLVGDYDSKEPVKVIHVHSEEQAMDLARDYYRLDRDDYEQDEGFEDKSLLDQFPKPKKATLKKINEWFEGQSWIQVADVIEGEAFRDNLVVHYTDPKRKERPNGSKGDAKDDR